MSTTEDERLSHFHVAPPKIKPWTQPCCLSHPLSTWCFTAFAGLLPWVNRVLNNSLAPGIVLGICHLLHRPSTTTQQWREMGECTPGCEDGVKQGWGSRATSLTTLNRKCGFLESLPWGQRSENRNGRSCYGTQMWQTKATAPISRCPKCTVQA